MFFKVFVVVKIKICFLQTKTKLTQVLSFHNVQIFDSYFFSSALVITLLTGEYVRLIFCDFNLVI